MQPPLDRTAVGCMQLYGPQFNSACTAAANALVWGAMIFVYEGRDYITNHHAG